MSRVFPLLATVAVAAAAGAPIARAGVRSGDRAVEFVSVESGSGRPVRLEQYRDRWLVLTFGASWCQPCRKELPAWDKLARQYARSAGKVAFIAVNIDRDKSRGERFMKGAKLRHVLAAYDPAGLTVRSYDPPTMPTTYIIDPTGIVRHIHQGYRPGDEQHLAAELARLVQAG